MAAGICVAAPNCGIVIQIVGDETRLVETIRIGHGLLNKADHVINVKPPFTLSRIRHAPPLFLFGMARSDVERKIMAKCLANNRSLASGTHFVPGFIPGFRIGARHHAACAA